ncbi:hypothetical protein IWW55_006368 [Coemansia sp. RSA 2706]|nr:hypothetical protein LPJ63_005060 [Coemansia sp. RSA 2711]KAJ1841729.1 hypothetical protein LPJ70_004114 [Coemansia sp. RSA 2708]KAJ2289093.1 hypothetical protein IWW55_006368 [Coemansia sp. RSA 2706]KAJ2299435.1 hypothetical protein IWW54_006487 [Coemansia sp. RSA 2705]KAJ2305683.1 hypothetical protein IWW52_006374 [Coemansia sp. RSA 2704]KAJ2315949.1 hypothetical protein IWW51_005772 [Coemansia sp. RSA 2702]KAJ2354672.1 hypothetical protein H4S01_007063 [Coemansia sp. RSA 2610]KAJ236174
MALAPAYAAHRLAAAGPHTLEVFLDFACPFSAKMWATLRTELIPHISAASTPVSVLFRHQVQPWHPVSTLMHEASLAVEKLSPANFALFADALFARQREFFDEATVNCTRTEIYKMLADVALAVNAVDDRQQLLQLLDIQASDAPRNAGNAVTNDLKYHIKLARAQGIHVSPTVVLDGIRDDGVSSSWTLEQWQAWLQPKLAA